MPFVDRIRKAQALMAEMGYGPSNHFHTSYSTTVNPDNLRSAAALQSMMHRIYIDLDIIQMDPSVYYTVLSTHQFDTAGSAWIRFQRRFDLPRPAAFRFRQQLRVYDSPAFDRIYADRSSRRTSSNAAR